MPANPIAFKIQSMKGRLGGAALEHRSLTASEAAVQGVKKASLFWLGALCSLPLPGFHFVLVPGFLIGSIFVYLKKFKSRHELMGELKCPNCQDQFPLRLQIQSIRQVRATCPHCMDQLDLIP